MALRVLLADENVTIKKVIQLSLQDYAVIVKSVNVGSDVLDVARSFEPDIILADILLQKRNGYDVCEDLKRDSKLSSIPVILLWSGFMELDQSKYRACRAEGELEKPFEAQKLRQVVERWVPKTQENDISEYITAPDLPQNLLKSPTEMAEAEEPIAEPIQTEAPLEPPTAEMDTASQWDMNQFDDIQEFVQKPLAAIPDTPEGISAEINENSISTSPDGLDFDFATPTETEPLSEPTAPTDEAPAGLDWQVNPPQKTADQEPRATISSDISNEPSTFEIDFGDELTAPAPESVPEPTYEPLNIDEPAESISPIDTSSASPISEPASETVSPQLSEQQLEQIIQAQSREVIENVVWKIVPDIAERVIREELERILKDPEMQV